MNGFPPQVLAANYFHGVDQTVTFKDRIFDMIYRPVFRPPTGKAFYTLLADAAERCVDTFPCFT
ncbi:hypothetical protein CPter291_0713 [Collimonas pratensis]|uniref:Uncharacterized protein n=1 Tax=Collimonas pratensis TaxID=279113 RepID=A0ABM5Z1L3_9BURK|nr:hypothetical protein CPter291_0713 [Collimonas pratensis]